MSQRPTIPTSADSQPCKTQRQEDTEKISGDGGDRKPSFVSYASPAIDYPTAV